jgi:subfamily B ATP-binding cassette protein MsbA
MAEPTKKKQRPPLSAVWREARELILANRGRLLLGLVLMLISRMAGLVLPWSAKPLFDEVIAKGHHELLSTLVFAALGAAVVQTVVGFALGQMLGVAAQRAINDMRKRVQDHVLRLPVSWFDGAKTGQLISRIMTDAEGIRNLVGNGIVQLVGSLVTAAFALAALCWFNWHLTLIILLVLLVSGGGMALAFSRLRPLFRERGKITADVTGRLNETLGGIRVVKAYVAEARERAVFTAGVDRLFDNVRRSMTGVSAVSAASTLVIAVVGAAMMLLGGRAVIAGTMSTGDLISFIFFVGLLAAPVVQIASIGTQVSEAFAGLDRIREVLRSPTEDADAASRAPCTAVAGEVAFSGVDFAYVEGRPVLRDLTFTAPAGSTTALVGSSGSGKSTLISLVMAFNQPQRGRIAIDGRELSGLRLADYRRHLGVVLQDNFLFDGTVAENIAFSRSDAPREAIIAAGRTAHCEEFVAAFPEGWDTIVGERGIKLSGGQRQRIAIARALLADPRILILDEATSSLDSESEAAIQGGLARLRAGRTTFVIAHRLSTIRSADQILVLEGGAIVERGTHDQLMAAAGRYRQLHDRQYRSESDRYANPGEEPKPA